MAKKLPARKPPAKAAPRYAANPARFSSRTEAASSSVPPPADWVETKGFYNAGDGGGALYKRASAATPGGFKSADGSWWALVAPHGWVSVLQFGALGDNWTNNQPFFQAAANYWAQWGGGGITIPPGVYQINSTITDGPNNPIHWESPVSEAVVLVTAQDITMFHVLSSRFIFENLAVSGCGTPGNQHIGFGATRPTILCDGSATLFMHCKLFGGAPVVRCTQTGVEPVFFGCEVTYTYSKELVDLQAGGWLVRNSLDQNLPTYDNINIGDPINPWINDHIYHVGNFAIVGNYVIQCVVAGVSGDAAPALKNFGVDIPDGSAHWQLAHYVNQNGWHFSSTCQEVHLELGDNAFPILIDANKFNYYITDTALSGVVVTGACQGIYVSHCELSAPWSYGAVSSAIVLGPAFIGDASITDTHATNVGQFGVHIQGGNKVRITNNTIEGATIAGVKGEPGTQCLVAENCISAPAPVVLAAGATGLISLNFLNGVAVPSGAGV
jgi:hypothetical protein